MSIDDGCVLNMNGGLITNLTYLGGDMVFARLAGDANFYGGETHFNSLRGCHGSDIMYYNILGNSGSVNAQDIGQAPTKIRINFGPGARMPMTIANSNNWAEILWNNDQLLYNGDSSTDLSKTWNDVTASGGLGSGYHFVYDNNTLSIGSTRSGLMFMIH